MKYELNASVDKYNVNPINNYLNKTGKQIRNNFKDMFVGYELNYGEHFIDNMEFENGYKINLIIVISKDEEFPKLKIALLDKYKNKLKQIELNVNTLKIGSEYKATIFYNDNEYNINLKVNTSTKIYNKNSHSIIEGIFDTTIDYKNEYVNVHFRIDAPYYQHSNDYNYTQEQKDEFYSEVYSIFKNLGWDIKTNNGCDYIYKDKQKLYLHPQDFSGDILKNDIKIIHEVLQNAKTFQSRWTDVYKNLYDIADEEYKNILLSKERFIKDDILNAFKTKRSNLYICDSWGVLENVFNKYKIQRLSCYNKYFGFGIMQEIFKELINNELIKTAECKNGTGYRTNKELLKKLKINVT